MVAPLIGYGLAALAALVVVSGKKSGSAGPARPKGAVVGSGTSPLFNNVGQASGGVLNGGSSSKTVVPGAIEYPDSYYVKPAPSNDFALLGPAGRLIDTVRNNTKVLDPAKVETFDAVMGYGATIPQPDRRKFANVYREPPVVDVQFAEAHPAYTVGTYNPATNVTSGGTTSSGAPAQSYAGTGESAGVSGSGDAGSSPGGSGD